MSRSIAERLAYNRNYNNQVLNPKIFGEDDLLKPEIRQAILDVVEEFLEYIQVDIRVIDVRLVGSNAAYNYTENSDLDIHIITNLSEISDPEMIARLYFDSVKKNFKDSYNIKIKGIEVEIYVEDINASSISNGIYSVTNNEWIKVPTATEEPTEAQKDKSNDLVDTIISSINSSDTVEQLSNIVDKIYLMRKDALSSEGENGAGNLAFKYIRNAGILDKVKEVLRKDKSDKLSLEGKQL